MCLIKKCVFVVSFQVWFKNRRAKCRQQLQHQTSSSVNSSKTSTGNNSSSAASRNSSNNSSSTNNASSKNASATSGNNNSSNKTSNSSSNPLKSSSHHHSGTNSSNNNNSSATNNNTNSTNNNTGTANGLGMSQQHNPSPILPMTPSTSVSPPINVICKKEISSFHHHNTSNGSVGNNDSSLKSSAYDSLKSDAELSGLSHHPSAYANINSRLGQSGTGNLTPLGSNSSIMTTPSPPITPQNHNPLSYVPNHEHNFWYNQYNQYPSNYNASYYTQMDYFQNQSQSNYNMGHTGYSTSNFGLNSGASLGGAMGAQAFSPNLDYMPQDKYVNMVQKLK